MPRGGGRRMRSAALILGLVGAPVAASGQEGPLIPVPSGQPVRFFEVIRDATGAGGLTYRFRFIAPEIAREGGSVDFRTAAADMEHLCNAYALARISNLGPQPKQVIVSLADRETEFGAATPEATQFFEAYRIADGVCVWEGF